MVPVFSASAPVTGRRTLSISGRLLIIGLAAALVTACGTGSTRGRGGLASRAGWEKSSIERLAQSYKARPGDRTTALAYGSALNRAGYGDQAINVLETATMRYPGDPELLMAYGTALADNGQLQQANVALSRAQDPARPDWRILSLQGSIADRMKNPVLARQYYEAALRIVPGEPSVLSNLGMSYAQNRQLPEAARYLRLAAASPNASEEVRNNYAAVLNLMDRGAPVNRETAERSTPRTTMARPTILKVPATVSRAVQSETTAHQSNRIEPQEKPLTARPDHPDRLVSPDMTPSQPVVTRPARPQERVNPVGEKPQQKTAPSKSIVAISAQDLAAANADDAATAEQMMQARKIDKQPWE